jgi:hypothetical protein
MWRHVGGGTEGEEKMGREWMRRGRKNSWGKNNEL